VASVLIVEPPSSERDQLVALLAGAGHVVACTSDGEDAYQLFRLGRHDVAIVDERAARRGGLDLAQRLKSDVPGGFQPVVLVSDRVDAAARAQALAVVDDLLARPWDPGELAARVEALLRTRRLVDQLKKQTAESEARALDDRVTGLRNRVFLSERLQEEWKRAARYNEPLSLLLVGLDGLRDVEAKRGQPAVDRVLCAVAASTLASLRQIDLVTRHGPFELAALLPNTHFAGSLVCAERLVKAVRNLDVDGVRPTMSMGVAFYPGKDLAEPQDLLRVATRALDRARQEGSGHVCLVQHQGYLFRPQ
jgi:diguanylate cyclase (GGDEF)-like protein